MSNKHSYTQKLFLITTTIAVSLISTFSNAAVIYFDDSQNPQVKLAANGATDAISIWDIDQNGIAEFALSIGFDDFTGAQGLRLETALNTSSVIYNTKTDLITSFADGVEVGTGGADLADASAALNILHLLDTTNTPPTDSNRFGFAFYVDGSRHKGWATILNSGTSSAPIATITEWAYEDIADATIAVGDMGSTAVPLPPSAHLLLLAIGMAGLSQFRGRRKGSSDVQKSQMAS